MLDLICSNIARPRTSHHITSRRGTAPPMETRVGWWKRWLAGCDQGRRRGLITGNKDRQHDSSTDTATDWRWIVFLAVLGHEGEPVDDVQALQDPASFVRHVSVPFMSGLYGSPPSHGPSQSAESSPPPPGERCSRLLLAGASLGLAPRSPDPGPWRCGREEKDAGSNFFKA